MDSFFVTCPQVFLVRCQSDWRSFLGEKGNILRHKYTWCKWWVCVRPPLDIYCRSEKAEANNLHSGISISNSSSTGPRSSPGPLGTSQSCRKKLIEQRVTSISKLLDVPPATDESDVSLRGACLSRLTICRCFSQSGLKGRRLQTLTIKKSKCIKLLGKILFGWMFADTKRSIERKED